MNSPQTAPAENAAPRFLSPEGLQEAVSWRRSRTPIYLPTPEGLAPATRIYEGRATAGPEHFGQLLLSAGRPALPDFNPDDWRELWPAPEAREPQPAITALRQALIELAAAETYFPTEPPTPAWTPQAAAALDGAVAAIYYAIGHSPELPMDDHPAEVSISRPDGIPYALTKIFQLQKELPDLLPAAPAGPGPKPPPAAMPTPIPPDHQTLLTGARADLEGVIAHWQSRCP